jgi:tripartite-type tricarboxylate transporter receptor subunit TctC
MLTRRSVLATLLVARTAQAQQARYPEQPVRLIVPFPPGGPADIVGRLVGKAMGDRLGQPFVVESRAGAGGLIGMEAVARARPDGYILGIASTGALTVLPGLMARMPFDPQRDLQPISQIIAVPQLLCVNAAVPARSVAELVALARRRPGSLTFASSGTGNSLHLAVELFRMRAGGMDIVHVPYRGAAPALTDLVAGQVQMMFGDVPVMLPQLRAGAIRALAVTSRRRSAALPEVPTMEEAGVPGVESETFYGLVAPAGLSEEHLALLHRTIVAALADPAVRGQLVDQGGEVAGNGPLEFAAHIRAETAKWAEVIRQAGVKME